MTELISNNGDVYIIRPCDEDDGCVVVEFYMTKEPKSVAAVQMLRKFGLPQHDEPDPEPTASIHIRGDVAADVARAILALTVPLPHETGGGLE